MQNRHLARERGIVTGQAFVADPSAESNGPEAENREPKAVAHAL